MGSCTAQPSFGTDRLTLVKTIPMPGVRGRIDHLEVNLQDQLLYVAALGNNTLEVVDLGSGKVVHEIQGLDAPQGVAYIPQHKEIFVANGGNGECYFYDAHYQKVATLHLGSDADDVRYDSLERKIYVGYGEGGIAVIDADSHRQIADMPLPVHPESFQIDRKLNRLYVNLPDANRVDVIDLTDNKVVAQWERSTPKANFPMAIDSGNGRVFVGYRHPARLVVFDATTGRELYSHAMTADADDLYYDPKTSEVIVSGGGGYINLFSQKDPGTYIPVANIATRSGARTSLLIPSLRMLVLAARATSDHPAALRLYNLNAPNSGHPGTSNP
ncbi:MAG: YncE family protein [Bacteroidota bacterium]|nr:YncE family protein [Bacteroidota bacterium]